MNTRGNLPRIEEQNESLQESIQLNTSVQKKQEEPFDARNFNTYEQATSPKFKQQVVIEKLNTVESNTYLLEEGNTRETTASFS